MEWVRLERDKAIKHAITSKERDAAVEAEVLCRIYDFINRWSPAVEREDEET